MFMEVFANPLNWVFMGIALMFGIILGIFIKPFVGNQVLKFIPSDHRFIELDIEEETAVSIECKKKKGFPLQRFFKFHPGFTGLAGRIIKKPVTKFLAIQGTAYTWKLEEGVNKLLGSLKDAVRSVWGEEFWSHVPDHQKELLAKAKIDVTVGLDKSPLTPHGMTSVSEEDIHKETDRKAAQTFWEEHGSRLKGQYINMILAGGMGAAIVFALFFLGVLSVPVIEVEIPVLIPAPTPASFLLQLFGR